LQLDRIAVTHRSCAGVLEVPFNKFDWGEVVQHRIMYFKYDGHIIWDKRGKERAQRVDNVFGASAACVCLVCLRGAALGRVCSLSYCRLAGQRRHHP
jgi:hypothetical protein